jgi:IstB-like ATP binding protein
LPLVRCGGAAFGVEGGAVCGAELLFQVLTEREEKASVAIASNESFSGWTKTFTDPRLCAAIVDRLTFGGNIIEAGTDSFCLAHSQWQDEAKAFGQRDLLLNNRLPNNSTVVVSRMTADPQVLTISPKTAEHADNTDA